MALGEGGGDSGADALGKKQYIVVLRPIYGGQLGLGLGVQGVKCLAQGGGAAAQAVFLSRSRIILILSSVKRTPQS